MRTKCIHLAAGALPVAADQLSGYFGVSRGAAHLPRRTPARLRIRAGATLPRFILLFLFFFFLGGGSEVGFVYLTLNLISFLL